MNPLSNPVPIKIRTTYSGISNFKKGDTVHVLDSEWKGMLGETCVSLICDCPMSWGIDRCPQCYTGGKELQLTNGYIACMSTIIKNITNRKYVKDFIEHLKVCGIPAERNESDYIYNKQSIVIGVK